MAPVLKTFNTESSPELGSGVNLRNSLFNGAGRFIQDSQAIGTRLVSNYNKFFPDVEASFNGINNVALLPAILPQSESGNIVTMDVDGTIIQRLGAVLRSIVGGTVAELIDPEVIEACKNIHTTPNTVFSVVSNRTPIVGATRIASQLTEATGAPTFMHIGRQSEGRGLLGNRKNFEQFMSHLVGRVVESGQQEATITHVFDVLRGAMTLRGDLSGSEARFVGSVTKALQEKGIKVNHAQFVGVNSKFAK